MNNMKVIFVNWTNPTKKDYEYSDAHTLMQKASIISAKKHTGLPVKLYTDSIGYEDFKKKGILDLVDEVDVDLLNSLDFVIGDQFWTSGKIISICNEEPPFIFMDLDLILKSDLPKWIYDYDLVHTHWEIIRGEYYITNNMLTEFGLNIPDFSEKMLIPNTSFLYINDKKITEKYLEYHIEIVNKKYDSVPKWLWLMSDQNILGYIVRKLNSNVSQIDGRVYVQYSDTHLSLGLPGHTPPWVNIGDHLTYNQPILNYEHVWFNKMILQDDNEYKLEKEAEWTKMVDEYNYNKSVI
jgi:hypothetical protein